MQNMLLLYTSLDSQQTYTELATLHDSSLRGIKDFKIVCTSVAAESLINDFLLKRNNKLC